MSADFIVESLCTITSSVFPLVSAAMLFWILSSFSGSVNTVASSRITIGAFLSIIRAMAMRCFSPPESRFPASPAGVLYPKGSLFINSSHCAAFAAALTSSSVASGFPRRMFSSREQLNKKLSCVTKLTYTCSKTE